MKALIRPGNVFVVGAVFAVGLHVVGAPFLLIAALVVIAAALLNHEEVKMRDKQKLHEEWQAEQRERLRQRGEWP
jgi:hypothetical protein